MSMLLCGIVHGDLQGRERLQKLLYAYKPDIISVEYDRDRFVELVAQHTILSADTPNLDVWLNKYRSLISIPESESIDGIESIDGVNWELARAVVANNGWEAAVPFQYMRARNVPIVYSDPPIDQNAPDLSAYESTAYDLRMAFTAYGKDVESQYASVQDTKDLCDASFSRWVIQRNRFANKKIEQAIRAKPKAALLHIGGAGHLYGHHPNLFDLLKKYHPQRMKLNEIQIAESTDALAARMHAFRTAS